MGDCKVGAQEESSSNLLQGDAGSVEVHQRGSQCETYASGVHFGRGALGSNVVFKAKTSVERSEVCGGDRSAFAHSSPDKRSAVH